MKNFRNQRIIASLVLGVLCITSCEKSEDVITKETIELNDEGFRSETGNNDLILDVKNEDVQYPVLHMSFDKSISKKEAEFQWNEAIKEYLKKNPIKNNKGSASDWHYWIQTETGDELYNQTDGLARAKVSFNTSAGNHHTSYVDLNNGDDRKSGQWDYYFFRASIVGQLVSWVEAEHAHLELTGTNGWVVKSFFVKIYPGDQTGYASSTLQDGVYGSFILSSPNIWLDNDYLNTWDRYNTGNVGIGRVIF
ncbi:hypothetical protein [Aquimarina aggregata]|uniref:hypothetical protein n=1 Tax=Aquimarina aggregata TaxID=1642818 RepID=UPI002490D170|nr:hypothetical protein [Aquimarina aggregata]